MGVRRGGLINWGRSKQDTHTQEIVLSTGAQKLCRAITKRHVEAALQVAVSLEGIGREIVKAREKRKTR